MRAAAVVVLLLVAASPARAEDELTRARQLEAALEYDQALAIVDQVLARGGADPAGHLPLRRRAERVPLVLRGAGVSLLPPALAAAATPRPTPRRRSTRICRRAWCAT